MPAGAVVDAASCGSYQRRVAEPPPSDFETAVLPGPLMGGGGPVRVTAKLVVLSGPDEGLERPLDGAVRVGSDPACRVPLTDPAVSRHHVEVRLAGGQIVVRDLGSRNGTFLGSTRIVEAAVPLGAVLTLGNTSLAIHPRLYVREVPPSTASRFGELYGDSVAMRQLFAVLERVAPSDVTVLVEGESGTGKELAARSLHRASARAAGPYVVFDCASIPRDLAESELFGHRRGAFSGAVEDRAGAFARAHGGTICLDEIGELPLELQPKLLRVLETGEARAVGEDMPRKVDVRIVASTNRELGAEARRGRFRPDLYYRLEVVKVRMPPLRARPEDIAGLAAHLLRGRLAPGDVIGGDNLARLVAYCFPGNVRELRNVLDRAVALAPALPRFAELVLNLGPASASPLTIGPTYPGLEGDLSYKVAKRQLLAGFDRLYVESLLERHGGNVSRAADAAELSRKALYDLIARATGEPESQE